MKAVISRVTEASVTVRDEQDGGYRLAGRITGPGLLVLLGVAVPDGPEEAARMVRKISELRILRDERSALDECAPVLVVSQFTLLGDTRKGRRPSWSAAARGDEAAVLVDEVVAGLRATGLTVETGEFGADMRIASVNDGPFTVLVDC